MTDPGRLSGIDIVGWVTRTVEKVERAAQSDPAAWAAAWLEAYRELGGQHASVGRKGCPRRAAYGLWLLGRLKTSRPQLSPKGAREILEALGRNATYAALAADVCVGNAEITTDEAWEIVKRRFRKDTGEKPTEVEQGQVKIAWALANAGLLRPSAAVAR